MTAWTVRQEEIIRELGHLGAEAVADAIWRECKVKRSVHAVQQHASVIHASLKYQPPCPECGVVGVTLNRRTGLCPKCTTLMHLREEVAFNELLLQEKDDAEVDGLAEAAERDRDAKRQANARLCKKYGLPTRRERKQGSSGCICPSCKHWPECCGRICDAG